MPATTSISTTTLPYASATALQTAMRCCASATFCTSWASACTFKTTAFLSTSSSYAPSGPPTPSTPSSKTTPSPLPKGSLPAPMPKPFGPRPTMPTWGMSYCSSWKTSTSATPSPACPTPILPPNCSTLSRPPTTGSHQRPHPALRIRLHAQGHSHPAHRPPLPLD
jgi:hypothetical protein